MMPKSSSETQSKILTEKDQKEKKERRKVTLVSCHSRRFRKHSAATKIALTRAQIGLFFCSRYHSFTTKYEIHTRTNDVCMCIMHTSPPYGGTMMSFGFSINEHQDGTTYHAAHATIDLLKKTFDERHKFA